MKPERIAYIRTSDRTSFKRCRRRWGFSSAMHLNREDKNQAGPLWMGTGFHFALEDYHSAKAYATPSEAFLDFAQATKRVKKMYQPTDVKDLTTLAVGMLDYYVQWLQDRDPLSTYVRDGFHQVEVLFEIPLDIPAEILEPTPYTAVHYTGAIDRVSIDEERRLWGIDFKSAKMFGELHFETDPQVDAYVWAMSKIYADMPIAGFLYQQHKKVVPEPPEFVVSKRKFSTAKNQHTTGRMYANALKNMYGKIKDAPEENQKFLVQLKGEETPDKDRLIQRDWIFKNQHQIDATEQKIILEACDMINPKLPLYPNPTRDCSWDCSFQGPCIGMDSGDDWEKTLELSTVSRSDPDNKWRKYLANTAA